MTLLLENHSDFTADEYGRIVDEVGDDRIGVFLDLINPVAALDDPFPVIASPRSAGPRRACQGLRLESILKDDGYHRRGFEVRYRYPGEGVADRRALMAALRAGVDGGSFSADDRGPGQQRTPTTSDRDSSRASPCCDRSHDAAAPPVRRPCA